MNTGDVENAFRTASYTHREQFRVQRLTAMPMETRGVVAYWDNDEGLLRVWDTTQAPVSIRNGLASLFGLPEHKVQVQAPDVGGGFGSKVMQFYPEEILVPLVAMRMGRPVKWIEDRREHFIATNHERLQLHDAGNNLFPDWTVNGRDDLFDRWARIIDDPAALATAVDMQRE